MDQNEKKVLLSIRNLDVVFGRGKKAFKAVDNVSFAPNNAINWIPTITALDEGFQLILDEGE